MKILFVIILSMISFFKQSNSNQSPHLVCKGIKWYDNETNYIEWRVIKGIPKYKVIFKIKDKTEIAKFSIRKGSAGTVIGTGGWSLKTGEKSSLTLTYSITNKIFKINSRYTDLRIEGKCNGDLDL